MTYVFLIAGGVVFGFLVFLMFRRRVKRDEKAKSLEGLKLTCQSCKREFDAGPAFRRSGLRGDLFICPSCGHRQWG